MNNSSICEKNLIVDDNHDHDDDDKIDIYELIKGMIIINLSDNLYE